MEEQIKIRVVVTVRNGNVYHSDFQLVTEEELNRLKQMFKNFRSLTHLEITDEFGDITFFHPDNLSEVTIRIIND